MATRFTEYHSEKARFAHVEAVADAGDLNGFCAEVLAETKHAAVMRLQGEGEVTYHRAAGVFGDEMTRILMRRLGPQVNREMNQATIRARCTGRDEEAARLEVNRRWIGVVDALVVVIRQPSVAELEA